MQVRIRFSCLKKIGSLSLIKFQMEVVKVMKQFKYLRTMFCKDSSDKVNVKNRIMQRRVVL